MTAHVLLIGSANTEEIIIVTDRLRENRKLSYANRFEGIGGSAVNWAVWLSAVRVDCRLVCPIGNDARGRRIASEIKSRGVKHFPEPGVALLEPEEDAEASPATEDLTSHSYILVAPTLGNSVSRTVVTRVGRSVSRWLSSIDVDIDEAFKDEIPIVMLGNIPVQTATPEHTASIINKLKAKSEEVFIFANLGKAQYLHPLTNSEWRDAFRKVSCFQFSSGEAKAFLKAQDVAQPSLGSIIDWFYKEEMNVIITLGRGGAVSIFPKHTGDRVLFSWPTPPAVLRDPTGAGDAFGAGFVANVLRTLQAGDDPFGRVDTISLSLGTGSFFGSKACESYGGAGSCPTDVKQQHKLRGIVGANMLMKKTRVEKRHEIDGELHALDREDE